MKKAQKRNIFATLAMTSCLFVFFNHQLIVSEMEHQDKQPEHIEEDLEEHLHEIKETNLAQLIKVRLPQAENKEAELIEDFSDYYPQDQINDPDPPNRQLKDVKKVTFQESHQFGNMLFDTATLALIGQKTAANVQIHPRVALKMRKVFSDLPLPSLDSSKDCVCEKCDKETLTSNCHKWQKVGVETILNSSISSDQYSKYVMMENSLPDLVVKNINVARSLFKPLLRKDAIAKVQDYFQQLMQEYGKDVTFISIHVRRTDYIIHLTNNLKGIPMDEKYYHYCIGEFLKKYPNSLFLVTSDDLGWCQKNIKHDNVIFPNIEGTIDKHVMDFTLLTQVNHSIIDYGAFGFWGALLAGGETLMADNYYWPQSETQDNILNAVKNNPISGWTLVNTRDIYLFPWLVMF